MEHDPRSGLARYMLLKMAQAVLLIVALRLLGHLVGR